MKAALEVGPRAIEIMKRAASDKVNMVTKRLVNFKEEKAKGMADGLDPRSVEQMIRDTSSGIEATSGHRIHSLINREYVKFFPNANSNLKTKLNHNFHDKSLNGEFISMNKEMEKKPLTGNVTYEDMVNLEKLKNDLIFDEVAA
jgi:hypothetical protein